MWTKIVLAALMAAATSARECGKLRIITYTDPECTAGEEVTDGPISSCSSDYFKTKVDRGTVAAYCGDDSMTFAFYQDSDTCVGNIDNAQSFKFGTCVKYTNAGTGSFLITETAKTEFDKLTYSEYETRFNQRWNPESKYNILNYGPFRRFVPPILNPKQLLTEIDRYEILMSTSPYFEFFTQDFMSAIGSLDAFDLFWYNNAGAAGTQLYPTGLSKYFDMYSWPGFFAYNFAWYWVWFCTLLTPFTFGIPLNIWLGILNGKTWEGIWKVLIPPYLAWAFNVKMEDGWSLY